MPFFMSSFLLVAETPPPSSDCRDAQPKLHTMNVALHFTAPNQVKNQVQTEPNLSRNPGARLTLLGGGRVLPLTVLLKD